MLEKKFDEYAEKYDLSDIMLKSRYKHCYRVMELCMKYAKELGFSESDIELAKIIGLLHDYGRFEQYKRYKSFIDKDTIDHADLGVEELFDKNDIIKFTDRKEDYDLIKFAIKNHNKLTIPDNNDERYIRFAKLIRDADKVDIMFLLGYGSEINEKGNNEEISEKVLEYIYKHEPIPVPITNNLNERIAVQFSFVFDINYDFVLEDYRNNFIVFYKIVEQNENFKPIYEEVMNYIEKRLNKDVRN